MYTVDSICTIVHGVGWRSTILWLRCTSRTSRSPIEPNSLKPVHYTVILLSCITDGRKITLLYKSLQYGPTVLQCTSINVLNINELYDQFPSSTLNSRTVILLLISLLTLSSIRLYRLDHLLYVAFRMLHCTLNERTVTLSYIAWL